MRIPGWIPKGLHIPPFAKRDALLLPALYLVNVFIFSSWLQLAQVATKPWLLLVWLYGLVMLVPLIWRDRAPLIVFATQWVLALAAWPLMPRYTPVVGIPVALYAVSVHCGRKTSIVALLASFIPNGLAAGVAFRVYPEYADQLASFTSNGIFLFIMTVAAWGAGRLTRAGLLHVRHLESERETARDAVTAERRRIARELHDIVSHAVTVIVLQAAGAARVADTNPSQVTQSLAHIEATGKQAMAELRRLLGVLAAGESSGHGAGIGELGPQPGLIDLPALLNSLRATGMTIAFDVEGVPRDLDPSVDLAAYRIAQEGLTNVLKHVGKNANPRLQLIWEAQDLLIQIDNDTTVTETRRGHGLSVGRGLLGLRERTQAVGGSLRAGPHHEDGYRLTATLPLAATARRASPSSSGTASIAVQGSGDRRGDQGKVST